MKISEAFPSKFLSAADLLSREVQLVIREVVLEKVSSDGDKKPCLYFKDRLKGMIVNKTNASAIAAVYGDEMNHWSGKAIVLYATQVQFQSKMVDAIRVRVPAPPSAPQAPVQQAAPPLPPAPPIAEEHPPEVPLTDDLNDPVPF